MEQIRKKHNEIKFQLIQESINKLRINLNLHSEYKICIIIFLIFLPNELL